MRLAAIRRRGVRPGLAPHRVAQFVRIHRSPRHLRDITRRCEHLITSLGQLPDQPTELATFCADLGRQWGLDIRLETMDLPPSSPSGFWARLPLPEPERDVHFLFVHEVCTQSRRTQAALHELAHVLLGHPGVPLSSLADRTPGGPSPSGCGSYHRNPDEAEAEVFATLLMLRCGLITPHATITAPPDSSAQPLLDRISLCLERPAGTNPA